MYVSKVTMLIILLYLLLYFILLCLLFTVTVVITFYLSFFTAEILCGQLYFLEYREFNETSKFHLRAEEGTF